MRKVDKWVLEYIKNYNQEHNTYDNEYEIIAHQLLAK